MRKKAPLGKGADQKARQNDNQGEETTTRNWTVALGLIMLAGTIAIWFRPMSVGQFFGSLNVACFAFGSLLALTSLLDLMATRLVNYGGKRFAFRPHAVGIVFICFLLIPAFLASWKQSFHRVRLCESRVMSNHGHHPAAIRFSFPSCQAGVREAQLPPPYERLSASHAGLDPLEHTKRELREIDDAIADLKDEATQFGGRRNTPRPCSSC
jgi:hypothetical protein